MAHALCRQETFSTADTGKDGRPLEIGSKFDTDGSSKKNDGFFEKAILTGKEGSTLTPEVKVIGNGHMHGASHRF